MKGTGNLASEITHVNKNKDAARDLNAVGNTGVLSGAGGAADKDVSWEKPSWTQNAGLKSTAKGRRIVQMLAYLLWMKASASPGSHCLIFIVLLSFFVVLLVCLSRVSFIK